MEILSCSIRRVSLKTFQPATTRLFSCNKHPQILAITEECHENAARFTITSSSLASSRGRHLKRLLDIMATLLSIKTSNWPSTVKLKTKWGVCRASRGLKEDSLYMIFLKHPPSSTLRCPTSRLKSAIRKSKYLSP
jgi:hypothetical protein